MKKLFFWSLFSISGIICFAQDLVVTDFTGPSSVVRYGVLTNQITIKNNGIVDINKYFRTAIYVSIDNVLDNSDFLVGQVYIGSIVAGESKTILPTYFCYSYEWIHEAAPGHFHLIIAADDQGNVSETDENNNQFTFALEVTAADVDFTFTSFSLDKTTCTNYDIIRPTFTITNKGATNIDAILSASFFLSTDNTFDDNDVMLDIAEWPMANKNTFSNNNSIALIMPTTTPGNYYIIGFADKSYAPSSFDETDENNNTVSLPITITAGSDVDLEISSLGSFNYSDET